MRHAITATLPMKLPMPAGLERPMRADRKPWEEGRIREMLMDNLVLSPDAAQRVEQTRAYREFAEMRDFLFNDYGNGITPEGVLDKLSQEEGDRRFATQSRYWEDLKRYQGSNLLYKLFRGQPDPEDYKPEPISQQHLYDLYSPEEQGVVLGVLGTLVGNGLVETQILVPPGKSYPIQPNLVFSPEVLPLALTPKAGRLIRYYLEKAWDERADEAATVKHGDSPSLEVVSP